MDEVNGRPADWQRARENYLKFCQRNVIVPMSEEDDLSLWYEAVEH